MKRFQKTLLGLAALACSVLASCASSGAWDRKAPSCQSQELRVVREKDSGPEDVVATTGHVPFSVELERAAPVMYDETLSPRRLSDEQLKEALAFAAQSAPRKVWFIWVHHNGVLGRGPARCNVSIYFVPSESTSRMRIGECVRRLDVPECNDLWRKDPKEFKDLKELFLQAYCQVSLVERPFGNDARIPVGGLLPFEVPEGFPVEDVVAISDLVRRRLAETDDDLRPSDEPIYRISYRTLPEKDGTIEVWLGVAPALMVSGGTSMHIERTPSGFKVLGVGTWGG